MCHSIPHANTSAQAVFKKPVEDIADKITAILREADKIFGSAAYGSGTRHYVTDVLIPIMEREGLGFCSVQKPEKKDLSYSDQMAKEFGEKLQADMSAVSEQMTWGNQVLPFLTIDKNQIVQIGDKVYTPKEIAMIFEQLVSMRIARTVDLTYGQANELAQIGKKMSRTGWVEKGLFMYYVPGGSFASLTAIAKEFGESVSYAPYFALRKPSGMTYMWVPSTGDILAKDWYVVE